MVHRGDRTSQLERLARLADGPRAPDEPAGAVPASAVPGARSARRRIRSIIGRSGPFASGVAAVLVALALYQQLAPRARPLTTQDVDQRVGAVLSSRSPGRRSRSSRSRPSSPRWSSSTRWADRRGWRRPGQRGAGQRRRRHRGWRLLTALHVVAEASRDRPDVRRRLDSREAHIADQDPTKDIAMLVADSLPRRVGPRCSATRARPVGSEAYVVGNPYGLFGSISGGVISGRDRTFQPPDTERPSAASSRSTPRSTRATPAARCSTAPARWWASSPR